VRQELLRLVRENYPSLSSELLRPLLELILLSRQYCDGDVDKFLILLVVALRTTEHPQFAMLAPETLAHGSSAALPGLGTNARSIAASLQMPKETVRRKVAELVEAGWLAREGYNLFYTGHAYGQLAPVRQQLTALAVRYFEVVEALVPAPVA
jgi:hypothetical protein